MRARGLKLNFEARLLVDPKSRPMRARGLKPIRDRLTWILCRVAPHAGAWIETSRMVSASGPSDVAPHAGAWIETPLEGGFHKTIGSRPMRARGLKLPNAGGK